MGSVGAVIETSPGRGNPGSRGLAILLLGSLEVRCNGRHIDLAGAKQRLLLAALALEANHVIPDDQLIDILWHGEPPETPQDVLRVHISKLRRVLTTSDVGHSRAPIDSVLVRRSPGYLLPLSTEQLDLWRCRRLIADARAATSSGDDTSALALLDEALGLWRGDPLMEFADEPFALAERTRIGHLRVEAYEDRFEAALRLGLHANVVGELEAIAVEHPLRERLQEQLMLALYRCGRQADASAVYQRTRDRLVNELGMEPGPSIQARLREILRHERGAAQDAGRVIPRPRLIGSSTRRDNLPVALSSFIGREQQIIELLGRLQTSRLLTLTGAGGIGKTRLAIRVAEGGRDAFPDGVWLVDLAPVTEAAQVPLEVLSALGLRQQPDASPEGSLAALLERRSALLILDNCEHLVTATSEIVELLLRRCPDLHILATSRERLGADGEQVWQVPSLHSAEWQPMSDVERLGSCEAIRLFVDRARNVRSSFELTIENAAAVSDLCTRLDGIPLALELAAARIAALSPSQLVDHLGDRFSLLGGSSNVSLPRHRTMRETIDWSYELLDEAERRLYRSLGVFTGTFDLTAVEAVVARDMLGGSQIVDLMSRLVDKSLVAFDQPGTGDGRYRLLETLGHHAREKLHATPGAASMYKRHAGHYLGVGEDCEAGFRRDEVALSIGRLRLEYDNARAALEWTEHHDPHLFVALCAAWWHHWWLQGLLSEGRRWLGRALGTASGTNQLRARVLLGIGRLAAIQGDRTLARDYFDQGLQLTRVFGPAGLVHASFLNSRGLIDLFFGSHSTGEAYFREALAIWDDVDDPVGLMSVLSNLGECAFYRNDFADARAWYLQALQRRGTVNLASTLLSIACLERHTGNEALAKSYGVRALRISYSLGAEIGIAQALEILAFIASSSGEAERAATLNASARCLYAARGAAPDPFPHRERAEQALAEVCAHLGPERASIASRVGVEMTVDEAVAFALVGEDAGGAMLTGN